MVVRLIRDYLEPLFFRKFFLQALSSSAKQYEVNFTECVSIERAIFRQKDK